MASGAAGDASGESGGQWWRVVRGCGGVVGARVCVRSKRMNDDDVGGPRLMSV